MFERAGEDKRKALQRQLALSLVGIGQCFSVARRERRGDNGVTKANLKPANAKARALLEKLQALAERGIDGEKISAQKKIARLKSRLDFSLPDPAETLDLFVGSFKRSTKARWIYSF